jgi:DNA-binding CsgD family transcriptional regulator
MHESGSDLTPREQEVAAMAAAGVASRDVAAGLDHGGSGDQP